MSKAEREEEETVLHEKALEQVEQIARDTPPDEAARRCRAALKKAQGWLADSNPPKPMRLL